MTSEEEEKDVAGFFRKEKKCRRRNIGENMED
jgi:hypothetical protein